MPWEDSLERQTIRRFNEKNRAHGRIHETGITPRDQVAGDANLRANGRFDDWTGIPLWVSFRFNLTPWGP